MKSFKEIWESRNPVHESNLDTGEDMFWGTAQKVAEEFCNQSPSIAGMKGEGELWWKQEYDAAVNEIGQLQEQLKEAEAEIRSLQQELRDSYNP